MEDHVHLLLSLPATVTVAAAVQQIKAGSSKWMHDNGRGDFEWQAGYGAFSIGTSQIPRTIAYIQGQAEHHATHDFRDEFLSFLKKHGIESDPQFVLG